MRNVLVVDDEPLVLRAVATILRQSGHHFRLAESGAEARAVMEGGGHDTPDVILTDLHLQDMTGSRCSPWRSTSPNPRSK